MKTRTQEAGIGMAGTIEKDPRYHPAFQRGYTGPPPERRAREEERFRRPRGGARAAAAALPDPAPSPLEPTPAPAPAPEPLDPALALGFEAPQERRIASGAASTGEYSKEELPRPALLDPAVARRVSRTLALSGVVLVAVALLALWWSSQNWYSYAPSADTFGPEQYLRTLCGLGAAPALTVGLIALCSAVLVPLLRATRR